MIEKIVKRFPIKRIIAVADRGLLSTDNLADLQAITLPGGGMLEFILAVPGRRYGEFVELLESFHSAQCVSAQSEVLSETAWNKLRLVIAHDPQVAREAGAKRDGRIQELEKQAAHWAGKLDEQDEGKPKRGRKLSMVERERGSTMRSATPIWRASCGLTSRASCSPTALMSVPCSMRA